MRLKTLKLLQDWIQETIKALRFHDGDYYKTLEAMASVYASTRDQKINAKMDKAIA